MAARGSALMKGAVMSKVPAGAGTRSELVAKAIRHAGAMHKAMGVPPNGPIPAAKLHQAAASTNPDVRRKARLTQMLGKMG